MKKIISFFMVFVLLITLFPLQQTKAATVNQHYKVSVDTKLNVREKPSTKAKVVGSLKNGTTVFVYSTEPGGWSKIKYNGKAGYVASSYLRRIGSFLLNKNKIYEFVEWEGLHVYKFFKTVNGQDYWNVTYTYTDGPKKLRPVSMAENEKGLYYNDVLVLKYPVKVGQKWSSGGHQRSIVATNQTIKTSGGTFKNAVKVKGTYQSGNAYYQYFVPGFGKVASEGINTDIPDETWELYKVRNK